MTMGKDFMDLRAIEFVPLSEVKAKLSEFVRKTSSGAKRVALTTNGRPSAVLMSYEDYLKFMGQRADVEAKYPIRKISLSAWRKEKANQESVRDTILNLFDPSKLSRKGQKNYKARLIRRYRDRKS